FILQKPIMLEFNRFCHLGKVRLLGNIDRQLRAGAEYNAFILPNWLIIMALASARKRFASHNPSAASPSAVELSSLGVWAALADVAKGGYGRLVFQQPQPARRVQSWEALPIQLTRLFCKQQRSSTSMSAERQTRSAW
ncbi:MAG TPA: hypothetical protein VN939_12965, partial [Chthoniobacterales bacterium]|nr:hypothetical protein [Chthoniobacterales bacterium]